MKLMRTEDAVGQVLCHDITQIIPGVTKDAVFRTFYCIVDLEPEMHAYTDEIFSPFKEAGFAVAKLSGVVPEVQSELVFLVSWDCRNGVVRREEIDDSIV